MAQANDSITVTPGTGATVATHLANSKEHSVVMIAGSDGHIKGSKDTFHAIYRLGTETAQSSLTFTFVANTDKQWATIHHTAAATKRKTIKRVEFLLSATAATVLNMELRRITSTTMPATGNPAITPVSSDPATTTTEAVCLALPTTAGSTTANTPLYSQELNLGANTAMTGGFDIYPFVMFPPTGTPADDDILEPVMRAGVAEGYAVVLRSTAAVAIRGVVRIIYTEE